MEKSLDSFYLARENLKRKTHRSISLLALVSLLSFTVFSSLLIIQSLKNGIAGVQNRLGADLIVVPEEYESEAQSLLFSGEPNYFYLDKSIEEELKSIQGIESVSSQFYFTSLSESCCSFPIQLIGFDEKSDFVVKAWAGEKYAANNEGEVILAGSSVPAEERSVRFFGERHSISAKLTKSASGLDSVIFVDMNTLKKIYDSAQKKGFSFISDGDTKTKTSTILCRLSPGAKSDTTSLLIRQKIKGVKVIQKEGFISHFEESISSLCIFLYALILIFLLASILILAVSFSLILNERLKEFAILRTLGANHSFLSKIVFFESVILGSFGGIFGLFFSSLIIFPFSNLISQKISLPFIIADFKQLLFFAFLTLLISLSSSLLSSLKSIFKISKYEPFGEVK